MRLLDAVKLPNDKHVGEVHAGVPYLEIPYGPDRSPRPRSYSGRRHPGRDSEHPGAVALWGLAYVTLEQCDRDGLIGNEITTRRGKMSKRSAKYQSSSAVCLQRRSRTAAREGN